VLVLVGLGGAPPKHREHAVGPVACARQTGRRESISEVHGRQERMTAIGGVPGREGGQEREERAAAASAAAAATTAAATADASCPGGSCCCCCSDGFCNICPLMAPAAVAAAATFVCPSSPPPPTPPTHTHTHTHARPADPPVAASSRPNIWGTVMALGFMRQMACRVPSSVSAAARHSISWVLPEPAGPTTMMPWRTFFIGGGGGG
jgi:hypothetical protein